MSLGLVDRDELAKFFEEMWKVDKKTFDAEDKYKVNLKGVIPDHPKGPINDEAHGDLLTDLHLSDLRKQPAVDAFMNLLDNYHSEVGVTEEITEEELRENETFLNAFMETDVGKMAYEFASTHDLISGNEEAFKERMNEIWFKPYERRAPRDSSAFKHVFVGEKRGHKVLGLHNWIQFARLEEMHQIEYKGHYDKHYGCHGKSPLMTISFSEGDAEKRIDSLLIGSSPEFDIAIYTLAFLAGFREVPFSLDGYDVELIVYHIHGDQLGTSYLVSMDGE